MSTTTSTPSRGSVGIVAAVAVFLGARITVYGLLVVPSSALGGLWIAAIGLSMVLSGVFATEWAGNRWGIPVAHRRRLSLGFALLAVLLLVAFVAVNFASFGGFEAESSG